MTAGDHSAALPDCVARGCLKKKQKMDKLVLIKETTHLQLIKELSYRFQKKQLSDKVKEATQPRLKAKRKSELIITPSKMSKSLKLENGILKKTLVLMKAMFLLADLPSHSLECLYD